MPARLHGNDVAGGPHTRIDHGDVYGAGWKVAVGPAQPEPRLRRPVRHDFVREIDDSRRREARQDDAFHYADEGALVAEVGRDGNHPAGAQRVNAQLRAWRPRRAWFASAQARQRSV